MDTVYLSRHVKRLTPLTVLYAPDEAWEDTLLSVENTLKVDLENHLFLNLARCEHLIQLEGQQIESFNGQLWNISVNEGGFPCFVAASPTGHSSMSCIVECNILARNGIVHFVDNVLPTPPATAHPTSPPTPQSSPSPTTTSPKTSLPTPDETNESSCSDSLTFETPSSDDPSIPMYSGIIFDVFTKSGPLEILSLEINVELSEVTDFDVEIYTTAGGYMSKLNNSSEWDLVANAESILSPQGNDAIIIPRKFFTPISFGSRERHSFYIQMKGPWIRNTAQALVKNGEVVFESADFYSYAGVGVSSPFPDSPETITDPIFSGKIFYQKPRACQDVAETIVVLSFLMGNGFDHLSLSTIRSSVQTVANDFLMKEDWFAKRASEAGLEVLDNPKTTTSPNHGSECPWSFCSSFSTQLAFRHHVDLPPGELRYNVYRYEEAITREVRSQANGEEIIYLGLKSTSADYSLSLTGVPSTQMHHEQERFFLESLVDFFHEAIQADTPLVDVFDSTLSEGSDMLRLLSVRRELDGTVFLDGVMYGGRSALLENSEFLDKLQRTLKEKEDALVSRLKHGNIFDSPLESVLMYFGTLTGIEGRFVIRNDSDADWETSSPSPSSVGPKADESTLEPTSASVFPGAPLCLFDKGMELAACFLNHPDTCASSCSSARREILADSLPGLAHMNCDSVTNTVITPVCDAISCCPPCVERLDKFLGCVTDEVLVSCDVECSFSKDTVSVGREKDTVVSVTTSQIFHECASQVQIDEGQPQGDILPLLDFLNCVVEAILNEYQKYLATWHNDTIATSSPTPSGSSSSASVQSFKYTDLSIRLEGAMSLTAESTTAFEEATEAFYRSVFSDNEGLRRRRQLKTFVEFDTQVIVTGEQLDSSGNTILYNQTVTFAAPAGAGSLDESTARNLILVLPLSTRDAKEKFVDTLQEENLDFGSVTSVDIPTSPKLDLDPPKVLSPQEQDNDDENDDNGKKSFGVLRILVILFVSGAVGFSVFLWRRSKDAAKELQVDKNDDCCDRPNRELENDELIFASEQQFSQNDQDDYLEDWDGDNADEVHSNSFVAADKGTDNGGEHTPFHV